MSDIPELRALDKRQQKEVWTATTWRRLGDRRSILLMVPHFAVVGLFYYLGGRFIPLSYGSAIGGGIGAGLSVFFFLVLSYNLSRPYLAEEIRRRSKG